VLAQNGPAFIFCGGVKEAGPFSYLSAPFLLLGSPAPPHAQKQVRSDSGRHLILVITQDSQVSKSGLPHPKRQLGQKQRSGLKPSKIALALTTLIFEGYNPGFNSSPDFNTAPRLNDLPCGRGKNLSFTINP